ncbi:MAG: signal peptidase II [Clostridia bacterium]|nr:signal peptidase II [Clostridia bacterium]
MISCVFALICSVIVLLLDQLTKAYVAAEFTLGQSAELINGFVELSYIHNRGAAWGIFNGNTFFLLAITAVTMIVCIIFLIKTGFKKPLLFWAVSLVISGGLGNLIDRIFRNGNVIDFFHFEFWPQFPVFNVADCAIVIGAGLLLLYFVIDAITEYKNKDNAEKTELSENADS